MAQERLMFAHAVEALFGRALRGQVTERLKARLRQAGLDLDRPLLPAYPIAVWIAALEISVSEPAYYEGLLKAALEEIGTPEPVVVSGGQRTDDGCTYRVTWGPQPLETQSPGEGRLQRRQPGGA